MKIVLLCKSDSLGGAAIVTYRLMDALCREGHDARMLVVDRRTDDPRVDLAGTPEHYRWAFYSERIRIFAANGLNRRDLFKVSTSRDGVDVLAHPWVKAADVVCLNWINQGLLSLRDLRRLAASGKKLVWTMHDMWCFTGICHHAYDCRGYVGSCGRCPFVRLRRRGDLSHRIWLQKRDIYAEAQIHFVAVSSWLADRARESLLLHRADVTVIPNALPVEQFAWQRTGDTSKTIVAMGAARLDDPVKGFELMIDAANYIADNAPDAASRIQLLLFGNLRNPEVLNTLRLSHRWIGPIAPDRIQSIYQGADVVLSSSHFETSGATLAEGLAAGCMPVAFDHGGQSDIIDHLQTGYLAKHPDAADLADGILWAASRRADRESLHKIAAERFGDRQVARRYIDFFNSLK